MKPPIFNGHSRDGRAIYPCPTCGRGRLHTNRERGEQAGSLVCPHCDGVPSTLSEDDVTWWAWKYGVRLRELVR